MDFAIDTFAQVVNTYNRVDTVPRGYKISYEVINKLPEFIFYKMTLYKLGAEITTSHYQYCYLRDSYAYLVLRSICRLVHDMLFINC